MLPTFITLNPNLGTLTLPESWPCPCGHLRLEPGDRVEDVTDASAEGEEVDAEVEGLARVRVRVRVRVSYYS